jgi:hypothetical protein
MKSGLRGCKRGVAGRCVDGWRCFFAHGEGVKAPLRRKL